MGNLLFRDNPPLENKQRYSLKGLDRGSNPILKKAGLNNKSWFSTDDDDMESKGFVERPSKKKGKDLSNIV